MKLYREYCFLNFFKFGIPTWDCSPKFVPVGYEETIIKSVMEIPMFQLGMEIFFICAVGILGIIIVELLNNKFMYLIDPICHIIENRYNFVLERNRLSSMNGHP